MGQLIEMRQVHGPTDEQSTTRYLDEYLALANIHERSGDWISATKTYRKILRIDRNHYAALLNLGAAYIQLGKFPRAFILTSRARQIEPMEDLPLHNLGCILELTGFCDKAAKYYQAALAINPKSPQTHWCLGRCFIRGNRPFEAIHHLRKFLELNRDPDDPLVEQAHSAIRMLEPRIPRLIR